MSEIDDIFAFKGKAKALVQRISSSSPSKKKKKKRSSTAVKTQNVISNDSSKKRPLPDTIVDTSHKLPTPAKRRKKEITNDIPENKPDDITSFKDSRGNTGRKRTNEGWIVYKEDELGINDQGGDTELCPFDCNCCF